MKLLSIYLKENTINLFDGEKSEVFFDFKEYEDIISNISNEKYSFFKKIQNDYGIKDSNFIIEKFLPLFHFILLNNTANYLMDKVYKEEYQILFEDHLDYMSAQAVKLTGVLTLGEIYNNIFNILSNYNKDTAKNVKIEKINYPSTEQAETKKIEDLFFYSPKEKEELKIRLEEDLIAFNYVQKDKKNKNNRYVLPIYIDVEGLKQKGLENIEDFQRNWESIAYLRMIIKIHDHFSDYYGLNLSKGLNNDILTTILFEIFDSEVKAYPKGLGKSIEVGRETAGKCFFINTVPSPVALSVDIALILQGKDMFSVTPVVSKNK